MSSTHRSHAPHGAPAAAPEPENPRQLGRSQLYSRAVLPERLTHWHSPRINRWERLDVIAGAVEIERLEAAGIKCEQLKRGDTRWIVPGARWRVARLSEDARFELEVHADSRGQAEDPQNLRADLLDKTERVTLADPAALLARAGEIAPGESALVTGRFDTGGLLQRVLDRGNFFWHPLTAAGDGFVAFVARSTEPFGLAEYMGRDHAVIEAALAGALQGRADYRRWLHATLARHLAIEEQLLFPAYVAAGGREAWVRGLENEHAHLRCYLAGLDQADSRRKFLRLLDGHDEKEERVVYPDIVSRLGESSAAILDSALRFVLPPDAIAVSDVQRPLPR